MVKHIVMLLLCMAWSVIAAGREAMYVKVSVELKNLEFMYGQLDDATANKIIAALRATPPFSHWNPVKGTDEVNRLEITFRGEPTVEISCRLFSEAGSTDKWLADPISVEKFKSNDANPDEVARKLVEAGIKLLEQRAVEMLQTEKGLRDIPIATAPAEWKNQKIGELVLPLSTTEYPMLLKANPLPRFRIRTDWEKEPSNPAVVDIIANGNGQSFAYPPKKEQFKGVVAVAEDVLYANQSLVAWRKKLSKMSLRILYLLPAETATVEVKRPKS